MNSGADGPGGDSLQSRGVLDVYLGDELIGQLEDRTLGYVVFDFDEQALLRHGVGSRLLSLAMPMDWKTVEPFLATAWFSGLLPEGRARERLAQDFGVPFQDTWGLLRLLGRESAGALVIVPPGEGLPANEQVELVAMSDEQLLAEVERLRVAPLGVTVQSEQVRLSLAGVQDKLPLVRLDDDGLALPLDGSPSTVICKPERDDVDYPGLVANEAFGLAVAAELGLPVATFEVREVGGRPLLLVDRYDRVREGERIVRLHQEDLAQATGVFPEAKYEAQGGPTLKRAGELIGEFSSQPALDRIALLQLIILNALLGNCDGHSKNLSLLHLQGGVQLAPAYDLVSTAVYPRLTTELAMRVGGAARLAEVDGQALEAAAAAIGLSRNAARRRIDQLQRALPDALDRAHARAAREGWATAVVDQIAAETRARAAHVFAA